MAFLHPKIPLQMASFVITCQALLLGSLLSVSSVEGNFKNRITLKLWSEM